MKKIIRVIYATFISCSFLFPTSMPILANAENIEEGTESVLVIYEYQGKENTIPLGEGMKAPQTGDTSNINLYFTITSLSFLLVLLLLYNKEKEKEL